MEYIDLDTAIVYCYSEEIFLKLVDNFTKDYKTFSLDLLELKKEEVLSKVHKLKGITMNLGAVQLYQSCLAVEKANNFDEELKNFIYIFNKSFKELLNI